MDKDAKPPVTQTQWKKTEPKKKDPDWMKGTIEPTTKK